MHAHEPHNRKRETSPVWSPQGLPREAGELLQDDRNEVYYSAASIWESAIKSSLRRKDFRVEISQLLNVLPAMGLIELP